MGLGSWNLFSRLLYLPLEVLYVFLSVRAECGDGEWAAAGAACVPGAAGNSSCVCAADTIIPTSWSNEISCIFWMIHLIKFFVCSAYCLMLKKLLKKISSYVASCSAYMFKCCLSHNFSLLPVHIQQLPVATSVHPVVLVLTHPRCLWEAPCPYAHLAPIQSPQ